MSKIIAFSGRKQSGKSTAGEFVQDFIEDNGLPLTHKIYSFADPLKQDICMNLLGLSESQCYGTDDDKNTLTNVRWMDMPLEIQQRHTADMVANEYLTARQVMEVVGTEIFRRMYGNVWVRATMNKISKDNLDIAVIVDCRFPNESDAILDQGGYVIRLDLDPFHSTSNSESALDPINYNWSKFSTVINNSTMAIEQKNHEILKFLNGLGVI